MNKSKFVIALLSGLVIILIFFPSVGATLRAPVVYAFGETASGIIGGVFGTLAIIGGLIWFIRWSSQQSLGASRRSLQGPPANSAPPPTVTTSTPQSSVEENERKQRVHDRVDQLATRVSEIADAYSKRSPFNGIGRQIDMESPEGREISRRYGAHIDEMRSKYRSEILPEATKVRGALADLGITDAQFDTVFRQPKTFEHVETVAERLWDMAGRLERSLN